MSLNREALALLVAVVVGACESGSSVSDSADCGKKCGACWDCDFRPDAGAGEIEFTREQVRDQIEGSWSGDGIKAKVVLLDAEPMFGMPYRIASGDMSCEVPLSAAAACAGMRVPAKVDVELVSPSVVFQANAVIIGGTKLATSGSVEPQVREFSGYPYASADISLNGREADVTVLFGPDAVWTSVDGKAFIRAGTKE